jgi:hypothetical protein
VDRPEAHMDVGIDQAGQHVEAVDVHLLAGRWGIGGD